MGGSLRHVRVQVSVSVSVSVSVRVRVRVSRLSVCENPEIGKLTVGERPVTQPSL